MEKADSMKERMGNINRDLEILKNNQKEMLEIKQTLTGMKNVLTKLSADWTPPRKILVSFNRNF